MATPPSALASPLRQVPTPRHFLTSSSAPAIPCQCPQLTHFHSYPQTWRLRLSRRACAARRCCHCCRSDASCCYTTARQMCGRAWRAPVMSPACRQPGQPADPGLPSHLCSTQPTDQARADPRHPGAPVVRPGGPALCRDAPGHLAQTVPRAANLRPGTLSSRERAAVTRRGRLPRDRRRGTTARSARAWATTATSGQPPEPSPGPIKATLLQTQPPQLVRWACHLECFSGVSVDPDALPLAPPASSSAGTCPGEEYRVDGWGRVCPAGRGDEPPTWETASSVGSHPLLGSPCPSSTGPSCSVTTHMPLPFGSEIPRKGVCYPHGSPKEGCLNSRLFLRLSRPPPHFHLRHSSCQGLPGTRALCPAPLHRPDGLSFPAGRVLQRPGGPRPRVTSTQTSTSLTLSIPYLTSAPAPHRYMPKVLG